MFVTLLRASNSALKELDTTLTPSEQDWRLFPGSWASPWDLAHFASSLGPQFPCLYNWKAGPDGFQGCSTLRPHDLDAQCASLLFLEGLWGQGCLGVVGVTPSSGRGCPYCRDQERELTRCGDRDGFLERNSAWDGERIPGHPTPIQFQILPKGRVWLNVIKPQLASCHLLSKTFVGS